MFMIFIQRENFINDFIQPSGNLTLRKFEENIMKKCFMRKWLVQARLRKPLKILRKS